MAETDDPRRSSEHRGQRPAGDYWASALEDPDAYDIWYSNATQDLAFWEWLIDDLKPGRVLELGCGTGRMLLPIAAKGKQVRDDFHLVGMDNNVAFLIRARERIQSCDKDIAKAITLVEGDMRSFELDSKFDLIILGFNTLPLLHEVEDQLGCFRAVHRHLNEEARFVIALESPDFKALAESIVPTSPVLRVTHDMPVPAHGVTRFVQYAASVYFPSTQMKYRHLVKEISYEDGRQERRVEGLRTHVFYPNELRLLLRLAELTPVEEYGAYDRSPFDDASEQFLWRICAL